MVPAWHTSTTPKGTVNTPAGLVIELGGKRVYHLGDTACSATCSCVKRCGRIDVALMPIGGHYTMDRFDAVVAAEFVGADQVIPCHYGTFPPIETDAEAFKSDVQHAGFAEVVILATRRHAHAMTTAVVLIEAERDATGDARRRARRPRGRRRGVLGHRRVGLRRDRPRPAPRDAADVITGQLLKLPGVSRTQTMVAFEVFSRHDLEAMFSIGGVKRERRVAGRPASRSVSSAA